MTIGFGIRLFVYTQDCAKIGDLVERNITMSENNNLETGWLSEITTPPIYFRTFVTIYLVTNVDDEIVNFFSEVGGFSLDQVQHHYKPTHTYRIHTIAWVEISDSSNKYPK